MDVFEAFPNAIIRYRYFLGSYQRGTLEGDKFEIESDLSVIVDEGDAGKIGGAPNAQALEADLLMYVKPMELPTLNTRELTAGYVVYDDKYGDCFAIINADIAKNQDTGEIEHIELMLRQIEGIQ